MRFTPDGRNLRVPRHLVGDEMERVERHAISSLDGALADPDLTSDLLAGLLGNAVHDEDEAAQDVDSKPENVGSFNQELEIFG